MVALRQSPLNDRHAAAGAKFAPFGDWEMPIDYGSVVSEHKAVREAVGLFDVSHLGTLRVRGAGALDFLNRCFTNDLSRITDGQAQYNLVCNDRGGVVDDLIVYRFADDDALVVPNAANAPVVAALLSAAAPAGVTVTDQHDDLAVLAVQGPLSDKVVTALGLPRPHDYMAFVTGQIKDVDVIVCRTGYTGERGYELILPAAAAGALWDRALEVGRDYGIRSIGLGARDTLRTEMGYPLHGHELSPDVSAVGSGASWAIAWDKPHFWGSDALRATRAEGPRRILRGLVATGRAIPRPDMEVVDDAGNALGVITSGTFSPTLGKGIALAMLDASVVNGQEVFVLVRGRREPFSVTRPPFVESKVR